jgi:hypothetical protein
MIGNNPAIVWPAPGFPAFVEPCDPHLDLLVASRNPCAEELRAWIGRSALRDLLDKTVVPMVLEELMPAAPAEVAERAAQFASLPETSGLFYFRARLRSPKPLPEMSVRKVQLFDLLVAGVVERARAVAACHQRGTTLTLAFACDLHVAAIWDDIAAAVARYEPALARDLVHPHRLLDQFIDEANALAARGDLDLVVLGGDLVDYVHTKPRSRNGHEDGSNVEHLLTMLGRLQIPTLATPGNHDYRSYPRRPRSSGLEVVGLDWKQSESLLRKAGMWDFMPFCRRDLDALSTIDAAGVPALADYLMRVSPATDYCCSVRGLHLVLASSGADILAKWRSVERARWGLFLRGLHTTRYHPDSEGFSDAQLERIRGWLRGTRGAAMFFHAPLLAAFPGKLIAKRLGRLDPSLCNSLAAQVRFERRVRSMGFRLGVSFRNPGGLIQALGATPGAVVTFSGHKHRSHAIEIDRRTMQARSIGVDKACGSQETLTLLTGPALGQLSPGQPQPGYLLARFAGGSLVSVQQRSLGIRELGDP